MDKFGKTEYAAKVEEALDLLLCIDQTMGYNRAVLRNEFIAKPDQVLLAMNTIALIKAT